MNKASGFASIALFPLHTVLFPGGFLPLQIFETRYVDLVRDCVRAGHGFGVVGIREGREAGTAALPHDVGTMAEIIDWRQGENGLLNIVVQGTDRFRINAHRVAANQLVTADIEWLAPPAAVTPPDQYAELRALLHKLLEYGDAIDRDNALAKLSNAQIAYRVAELLPLSTADKTVLLNMHDDHALLLAVQAALSRIFTQRSIKH